MAKPMKDIVVLLPGITGSVLQKDGKDVWAFSGGAAIRALLSLGESITDLELHGDDPDVDDLGDGITATRIMPDIHLIPGLWKIDGYGRIAKAIHDQFEVETGVNFFEFPYDWRRDNRVAARKLARESHDWLEAWRQRSGNEDAKLIFVVHSMGGLIARHFLELLDGWKDTRALISFGTPYRGSLNALSFLVNGMRKGLGPITLIDLSALLRSFTSVYQLLPIYRCVDVGGSELVRIAETDGIPNVDSARAKDAASFHHAIQDAVEAHREESAYRDGGYQIHPVVGTYQRTSQSARLTGDGIHLLAEYDGIDQDGDGTVPRVSATPIELSDDPREMYASERHATLQNKAQVLTQLMGVLSREEIDLSRYRDALGRPRPRVSLEVEDLYLSDEPITARIRCEEESYMVRAVVHDADGGDIVSYSEPIPGGDWADIELAPLPPGAYRITVGEDAPVEPVSDIFVTDEDRRPGA
jgi:pimeloyl-ACP methyl ester carboxylesterase